MKSNNEELIRQPAGFRGSLGNSSTTFSSLIETRFGFVSLENSVLLGVNKLNLSSKTHSSLRRRSRSFSKNSLRRDFDRPSGILNK